MASKKLRKNIVILFGGPGSEHEVSAMSAASVLKNIDLEKYNVICIGITKSGKWIETKGSSEELRSGDWKDRTDNLRTYISPDREIHGIVREGGEKLRIDGVFPLIHGTDGEDGGIQGLLQLGGIPCVGSNVLAAACTMDKPTTKILVDRLGIRQVKYSTVDTYRISSSKDMEANIDRVENIFGGGYPLFVKPGSGGSSVGVSKASNREQLKYGIELAALESAKVLVEEAIDGREFEVAVMGNRTVETSPVGEVIAATEFYDYNAKYDNPESKTEIVRDLSQDKLDSIRDMAADVYLGLGCKGMARVDFFMEEDGTVYFSEINSIPGFTKISMYPRLWLETGMGYGELIDRLIELAME